MPFPVRPAPAQSLSAHERFGMVRRDMLNAWLVWLAAHPNPADLAEEIDATTAAMRGLVILAEAGNGA